MGCEDCYTIKTQKGFKHFRTVFLVLLFLLAPLFIIGLSAWTRFFAVHENFYTNDEILSIPSIFPLSFYNNYTELPPQRELNKLINTTIVYGDTHSHTDNSDGELTVEQNVIYHTKYNMMIDIISDHNKVINVTNICQQYNILCPLSTEWSPRNVHLILVGIVNDIWNLNTLDILEASDNDIKTIIDKSHSKGGIVIGGHPRDDMVDKLISLGVDYLEVVNNQTFYPIVWDRYKKGLVGAVCGTDLHRPTHPTCWNAFGLLGQSPFTVEDVMDALRKHRVVPNYQPGLAPPLPLIGQTSQAYKALELPYRIGDIISSSFTSTLQIYFFFFLSFIFMSFFTLMIIVPTVFCWENCCCHKQCLRTKCCCSELWLLTHCSWLYDLSADQELI